MTQIALDAKLNDGIWRHSAPTGPPMSIVQVVDTLGYGGLERVVADLANGLSRRGHRLTVCCLRGPGPLSKSLHSTVNLIALAAAGRRPGTYQRLREALLATKADLAHGHNIATWWDTAQAARGVVPHVQTFHGLLRDGHTFRQRLKGRILSCSGAQLTTVTQGLAAELVDLWGVRKGRFAVIHNGIDTRRFVRAPRDSAALQFRRMVDARFVCTTVASLSPAKSPLLWIEALGLLPPEYGVIWVGDGPLRGEFELAIRRHGLGRRVILAGTQADVRPYFAAADVFVMTSRSEALPISLLEAMACGLPVVAPRLEGIEEVVQHQVTGMLYPAQDAHGLAKAVLRLNADPAARAAMSAAARSMVCARFDIEQMVTGYESVYVRCCRAPSLNMVSQE